MELQKTRFLQSVGGHYIHVKRKRKRKRKTHFWTNDHWRSISQWQTAEGADASSVLWTCAQPRIATESVSASGIWTQTGTWSAPLLLLLRCNGMTWQGWPFPVEMQIWSGIEISLWTLYGACACTWKVTTPEIISKLLCADALNETVPVIFTAPASPSSIHPSTGPETKRGDDTFFNLHRTSRLI